MLFTPTVQCELCGDVYPIESGHVCLQDSRADVLPRGGGRYYAGDFTPLPVEDRIDTSLRAILAELRQVRQELKNRH